MPQDFVYPQAGMKLSCCTHRGSATVQITKADRFMQHTPHLVLYIPATEHLLLAMTLVSCVLEVVRLSAEVCERELPGFAPLR
jgi:hypothetical protein